MDFNEQPPVYQATNNLKIYKPTAVRVATFLGGPLVAGYVIAENYKAFNKQKEVRITWIIAIVVTLILFGGIFLTPDSVKIPRIIIPLIYSWISFYLVQYYQGKDIDMHINNGGLVFSWWRVIGVGLIGTAITIAVIFVAILFFQP